MNRFVGGAVDPRDALACAKRALTQGHYENQSMEGANANALESIAWSLMGILECLIKDEAPDAGPLRAALEDSGIVRIRG